MNAQETRQRRLEEATAATRRTTQLNGDHPETLARQEMLLGHPPLSARMLTTQVSSVRDEPTPAPTPTSASVSRAQSPVLGSGSKEGSPHPVDTSEPTAVDGSSIATKTKEETANEAKEAKEHDRKSLADSLFKIMLTKIDSQPSSSPSDQPDRNQQDPKVIPKREEREVNIKTSDFVKQGLIPISMAWRAFEQGSKNERAAETGDGEGMDRVEFSLGAL